MKVLVCGDRHWGTKRVLVCERNESIASAHGHDSNCYVTEIDQTQIQFLFDKLDELHKVHHFTTVIEGEARGADTFAARWGRDSQVPVEKYPADWIKYGKAAGPIRNKQMLDEGKPDLVVAFHNDIEQSRGTKNMVTQAEKAEIPVIVCKQNWNLK